MPLLSNTPDGKVTDLFAFPDNSVDEVMAAVRVCERAGCADLLPMLGVRS